MKNKNKKNLNLQNKKGFQHAIKDIKILSFAGRTIKILEIAKTVISIITLVFIGFEVFNAIKQYFDKV